jgi:hypothetical protein
MNILDHIQKIANEYFGGNFTIEKSDNQYRLSFDLVAVSKGATLAQALASFLEHGARNLRHQEAHR